jgi:DNA-directed RNA polymerase subunit H
MVKKEAKKHDLIPKHKKLSDKDKAKVLESYKITFKELPAILTSDPTLIGMDVEEGDVIMIERASPTAGSTVFYRGVIDD